MLIRFIICGEKGKYVLTEVNPIESAIDKSIVRVTRYPSGTKVTYERLANLRVLAIFGVGGSSLARILRPDVLP